MTPRFSRARACAMKERGVRIKDIALDMGVSRRVIGRATSHIPSVRGPRRRFDRRAAFHLREQGMTYKEVASVLGVTAPAIYEALNPYRGRRAS